MKVGDGKKMRQVSRGGWMDGNIRNLCCSRVLDCIKLNHAHKLCNT